MSERDPEGGKRRRLDSVIPDLIKRAVEMGVEKATEAPDSLKHLVGDMKVPKEIVHLLLSQIDETKNGLFRVVAKEMRDFLEHTNISAEMQKLLTTVQFEINTTIRFSPNDAPPAETSSKEATEAGAAKNPATGDAPAPPPPPLSKPQVKTQVHMKREERTRDRRRPRE